MFFIVNKTTNTIVLSDIKVSLGPRQGIDLDKIVSRDFLDKSDCLRSSISKGQIEVRIKDNVSEEKFIQNTKIDNKENVDLTEVKNDIIKEVSENLNKTLIEFLSQKKDGITKEDLESSIKSVISSIPANISNTSITEKRKDSIIEIDDEILSNISARTVDKIVKNSDASVKYEEKKEKNTIIHDISELEDLLG